MYETILVPVDNSVHSRVAGDVAIRLAGELGAKLVGSHAYAARLHDMRFKQMEFALPEKYLVESEMEKQRDVHESLITTGLELISDSYLVAVEEKAKKMGVEFESRMYDGRNFKVIADDIRQNGYDLVVMGALGQGAVRESLIGSVCERVVRRARTDTLVIRDTTSVDAQFVTTSDGDNRNGAGGIVAALDGSPESFAGLKTALRFGRALNKSVEAISVYDPYLHHTLFNSLEKVLTERAAKAFNFREQETLHENVIDSGLARIYRGHLDVGRRIAESESVDLKITLLDGKVFEKVLEYVRQVRPWLIVMGRIGVHSDESMDIGSNTENLLRLAPCNVLLSSQRYTPAIDDMAEEYLIWAEPAQRILERAPDFARGIARTAVHHWAIERGHSVITTTVLQKALSTMLPEKTLRSMGIVTGSVSEDDATDPATQDNAISWTPDAVERLNRIPEGFMRTSTKSLVETIARESNIDPIDLEFVEAGIADGAKSMQEMISKKAGK